MKHKNFILSSAYIAVLSWGCKYHIAPPLATLLYRAIVYSRGGQSAARQRLSVAPVSNFECTTKLFMMHL